MGGPLDGIKVVEMGVWVAGPSAAGVLADWGADVIKVEPPAGDPMRRLFDAVAALKEPSSPPFDLDNRGKRSKDTEVAELTVDLQALKSGAETEEWYPLTGVTPIGEWGSLRLKLR